MGGKHKELAVSTLAVIKRYWIPIILGLILTNLLFILLYNAMKESFVKEVRNNSKYWATEVAIGINPADVEAVRTREDMASPAFKRIQDHLVAFRNRFPDIKYSYVMRRSEKPFAPPSDYIYVVDIPATDVNDNKAIDIDEEMMPTGTTYDASGFPAMVTAWDHPDADLDLVADSPYPSLLSGYAPIKKSDGKTVGIVGVDILSQTIDGKLRMSRIIIAAVGIIFSILIAGILFSYFSRRMMQDRIEAINDELTEKNEKIMVSMKLRDELSRMIIHDMCNPLWMITGYIDMIADGLVATNDEIKETFENIRVQSQRLTHFIDDILILAKSEAGKLILNKTLTDINALVRKSKSSNDVIAQLVSVNISVSLPNESKTIDIDKDLISRVLDNLLGNAFKYAPRNSTVSISVEYADTPGQAPKTRIKVADEGRGVGDDHKQKIFKKFETTDSLPIQGKQIGLGLTFCKMAVDAHGGSIHVEDNKPHGAVFVVEI